MNAREEFLNKQIKMRWACLTQDLHDFSCFGGMPPEREAAFKAKIGAIAKDRKEHTALWQKRNGFNKSDLGGK